MPEPTSEKKQVKPSQALEKRKKTKPQTRDISGGGEATIAKEPLYVPPGQMAPYCYYPPFCDLQSLSGVGLGDWRLVSLKVRIDTTALPDHELINGWIRQLLAIELGKWLVQAEKQLDKKLEIRLDFDSIELIRKALELRAKEKTGA